MCEALPNFSQAPQWIQTRFNGSKARFRKFITKHKKLNTWTDDDGFMVQATALLLCRRIILVGTANAIPENKGFSVIEGGPGSESHPPLIVGYYQGNHYQSLQIVERGAMEEKGAGAFDFLGNFFFKFNLGKKLWSKPYILCQVLLQVHLLESLRRHLLLRESHLQERSTP